MDRVFCNREFKPKIKNRDTEEIEKQIKTKLQPIRIELEEKVNNLINSYQNQYKIQVILHQEYPEIKVVFSVNIEKFNI